MVIILIVLLSREKKKVENRSIVTDVVALKPPVPKEIKGRKKEETKASLVHLVFFLSIVNTIVCYYIN